MNFKPLHSLALITVILALIIFFPGCKKNEADKKKDNLPTRTITDLRGNKVVIPEKIERLALFGGPSGQIAYILGVQDKLCAITKTLKTSELAGIFDPRVKTIPGPRTTSGNINIESLIKARPELLIAGDIDGQIVEKKTSIPVAYFGDSMDNGIDEIKKEIKFYGRVLNAKDRAKRYCLYLDRMTTFLKAKTSGIPDNKRKKVFNGYNPNHLVTLGGDTFLQERIAIAGCINASEPIRTTGKKEGLHSGLDEVSMEQVLGWNPDIMIINFGTPESVYKNYRWRTIKAVKNKQVYVQPAGIFIWNRPTAEGAVLYPLWLAKTAYPEIFRDISLVKEFQKFYKQIFEFDLTEKHVKKILSGDFKKSIMSGAK